MTDDNRESGQTDTTGAGNEPGNDNQQQPEPQRQFTQADLDRIAGRTRAEARQTLLNDLGVENLDDLHALVDSQRQAEEARRTDLERAQAEAEQYRQQAADAQQQMQEILLRTRFQLSVADEVADVDLAYLAAREAGLLSPDGGVEVDLQSSTVSGLEQAIKALLEQRPILKRQAPARQATGTDGNQANNDRVQPDRERLRAKYGI